MPTLTYRLADVFTDRPLSGNQLAVFHGPPADDALMRAIAREMNLSETVFLVPPRGDADARVRMFSTVREIPFAGHPLLGTACVLADRDGVPDTRVTRLETERGIVPVRVRREATGRFTAWMEQPLPDVADWPDPDDLVEVLGLAASKLPVEVYDNGLRHVYVTAASPADVAGIVPDFPALGKLVGDAHVNVFAGAGDRYTTRMFSPFDYVPEDPACGSAAGPLAVHLLRHGRLRPGREITLSQGEQVGRPSTLYAVAEGTPERIESVRVGGSVCLIGGGHLDLP